MIGYCRASASDTAFVRTMLDFVDCQALSIGENGYRALAAPGSSLSLTLTALFTIMVALIGYRMLMGKAPSLQDGALALVKIGLVLALATGWSAYRTLFYDVALRAPAQLAAEIAGPAHLPGVSGGLAERLQALDDGLAVLAKSDAAQSGAVTPAPSQGGTATIPPPPAASVTAASPAGKARVVMLVSALGALATTRLLTGMLLAIGPFFIACLLFSGTRGLFIGWLRGLIGTALGACGTSLMLGVALAYLEPGLAALLQKRAAGIPGDDGAAMLLVATLIFALALVGMLIGMARVAAGLRWPCSITGNTTTVSAQGMEMRRTPPWVDPSLAPAMHDRSRAAVIADAVAGQQRREQGGTAQGGTARTAPLARRARTENLPYTPLGQSLRRQAHGRLSHAMNRRNAS